MKDIFHHKIYWTSIALIFGASLFISYEFIFGGRYVDLIIGDNPLALIKFWLLTISCAAIPTFIVIIMRLFGSKWVGVVAFLPIRYVSLLLSVKFVDKFHTGLKREISSHGYWNGTQDIWLEASLRKDLLILFYSLALFSIFSLFTFFTSKILVHIWFRWRN